MIGRRSELAWLLDGLREPVDGASVLTLVGDTGSGKSRLLAEAVGAAGVPVLIVQGEPDGTTSPYRAFRDAMRGLLGVERADQATMAQHLSTAIERLEPGLLPMLPLVGAVAHIDVPPTPESQAIEPRFLLDRRAARRPAARADPARQGRHRGGGRPVD